MDILVENEEIKEFLDSGLGYLIGKNIGEHLPEILEFAMDGCSDEEKDKASSVLKVFLDEFTKEKEDNNIHIFDTEGMLIPETVCHVRLKTHEFDRFVNTVLDKQAVVLRYNGLRYVIFSSDSLPTIYEEVIEKTNGKKNNK